MLFSPSDCCAGENFSARFASEVSITNWPSWAHVLRKTWNMVVHGAESYKIIFAVSLFYSLIAIVQCRRRWIPVVVCFCSQVFDQWNRLNGCCLISILLLAQNISKGTKYWYVCSSTASCVNTDDISTSQQMRNGWKHLLRKTATSTTITK